MKREEIIEQVVKKYGRPRWEVEFAADDLLGVVRPKQPAATMVRLSEKEATWLGKKT